MCLLFAYRLVRIVVLIRAFVANNNNYLNKTTNDETFYININFKQLQEILKEVLQRVKGICLKGEELIVCLYIKLKKLESLN
jgi:hypothetical protein